MSLVFNSFKFLVYGRLLTELIYRYLSHHQPKSSPRFTSSMSHISLPLGKFSRTSGARRPSQLGSRQTVYSTPNLSVAGWPARLMF